MKLCGLLAVALPVVAIALGVALPTAPAEALKAGVTGYRQVVDTILVPERILFATDELKLARQTFGSRPKGLVVDIDDDRLDEVARRLGLEKLREFAERSFLRADIARNDPALWSDDNVLLGFAREPHVLTSPFDALNWTGSLQYNGDSTAATFVSAGGGANWQELSGRDGQLIRAGKDRKSGYEVVGFASGRIEIIGNPNGELILGADKELGSFRLYGGVTAFYCDSNDPVKPANADLQLTPGVCVELRGSAGAGGQSLRLIELKQSRVISNDSGLQLAGPASLPYARLAQSVRSGMSDWVQNHCGGECPEADRVLKSSLDPQISRFAQWVVEDSVGDFGFDRSVGVTIMDGRTGEVLAMASVDGDPLYQRDPRHGQQDLNFIDLTIGSAAKPLIAQAIFAQEEAKRGRSPGPDFSHLEINENEPRISGNRVTHVLGVPLGGPLEAAAVPSRGGWLNASEFVKYSSNYYAAGLALLASCTRGDAQGKRDENKFTMVPDDVKPCPSSARAVETNICPPWRSAFDSLYIGDPNSTLADDNNCRLPDGGWRPSHMSVWGHGERENRLDASMAESLPRPFALGWHFGNLVDYRSQIVNMMIGGQAYPWNNVLLAQSYARLVTGYRVEASLLAKDGESRTPLQFGQTGPVCDGLEGVASGGTAGSGLPVLVADWQRAEERAARPADLVLFSKTGTPTVEAPSDSETGRTGAIDKCIRDEKLRLDRSGTGEAAGWRIGGESCGGVLPQALPPDSLTGRGKEAIELGRVALSTIDGRLTRAIARIDGQYKPKVFVFALTRRRAADEPPRRSGCHQVADSGPVLVVAINVNDPKAKSNAAHLEIARRLLAANGALRDWFVKRLR